MVLFAGFIESILSFTALHINLYNPQNVDVYSAIVIALLLGFVHGITPDEHTWPITFSYAVGSYSTKGGAKAGLIFSTGFTIQRAVLSEVAYLALAGIFMTSAAFGITYVIVGIAMFVAGMYIKNKKIYPHWHWLEEKLGCFFGVHKAGSRCYRLEEEHKLNPIESTDATKELRAVPSRLAFLHGIIAGFGFGAFALIIYTVLSPAMPNAWVGWIPGFMFGIGTMIMQILFGAGFGTWLSRAKRLTQKGIAFVARTISSDVLFYGGLAFVLAGILILAYPKILTYGISTGIKIHNLGNLGIGFFIVIFVVVVIGLLSYLRAMRIASESKALCCATGSA
ncbi:MAG: hypothetical protein QW346_03265 [Candidatus Micrarchaeaceae archaeon]